MWGVGCGVWGAGGGVRGVECRIWVLGCKKEFLAQQQERFPLCVRKSMHAQAMSQNISPISYISSSSTQVEYRVAKKARM